jgi:hypothetical protein
MGAYNHNGGATKTWLDVIRNFTPAWFSVIMGKLRNPLHLSPLLQLEAASGSYLSAIAMHHDTV